MNIDPQVAFRLFDLQMAFLDGLVTGVVGLALGLIVWRIIRGQDK